MSKLKPYVMWLLALTFFTMQYIGRNTIALIQPELIVKFNLDAFEYGTLVSFFYITYATMQIPYGLLLDSFRVRYVLSITILVYTLGTVLFAVSTSLPLMLLARMLIGLGAVGGFLGTVKVLSLWFNEERYSQMVALTFSVGFMGSIYSGAPSAILIEKLGWEEFYLVQAIPAIALAVIIFLFLRAPSQHLSSKISGWHELKGKLSKIVMHRRILWFSLAGGMMVGAIDGFADAWGVPLLTASGALNKAEASFATSLIFLGLAIGGPVISWVADRYQWHHKLIVVCGLVLALALVIVIHIEMPYVLVCTCCFIVGAASSYQILVFVVNNYMVPKNLSAVTAAVTNSIIMSFGFLFHPLIGAVVEFAWDGMIVDGNHHYSIDAYQYGLMIIPTMALIGTAMCYTLSRGRK